MSINNYLYWLLILLLISFPHDNVSKTSTASVQAYNWCTDEHDSVTDDQQKSQENTTFPVQRETNLSVGSCRPTNKSRHSLATELLANDGVGSTPMIKGTS